MTQHDKADEARKGLIDTIKGKAKEVAGAVAGNDSLTIEGQLDQAQALERKEASSVQAVADAEAEQARDELAAAQTESAQNRATVISQTVAAEREVRDQQHARKQAAERAGAQEAIGETTRVDADARRDVEQSKAQERVEVRAAASDLDDAVDEHDTASRIAANAHEEADRIRAHADRLSDDAQLP